MRKHFQSHLLLVVVPALNLKVSNATFAYTRRRPQTHLIPKVNGITFIINTVFLGDTPADVKPA